MNAPPILTAPDGLVFEDAGGTWKVPPFALHAGQWMALVPDDPHPATTPGGSLARTLCSLRPPVRGALRILDQNVYRLTYRETQRLRAHIGFVQAFGGLLSNRTIRENIALPLGTHSKADADTQKARIDALLREFALEEVADVRPHRIDGYSRWRACLARALALEPALVVLDGIGDFDVDGGRGVTWTGLLRYHRSGRAAMCACPSRPNPSFEAWLVENGGIVMPYQRTRSSKGTR